MPPPLISFAPWLQVVTTKVWQGPGWSEDSTTQVADCRGDDGMVEGLPHSLEGTAMFTEWSARDQ